MTGKTYNYYLEKKKEKKKLLIYVSIYENCILLNSPMNEKRKGK
jgi:hypothetical protein